MRCARFMESIRGKFCKTTNLRSRCCFKHYQAMPFKFVSSYQILHFSVGRGCFLSCFAPSLCLTCGNATVTSLPRSTNIHAEVNQERRHHEFCQKLSSKTKRRDFLSSEGRFFKSTLAQASLGVFLPGEAAFGSWT